MVSCLFAKVGQNLIQVFRRKPAKTGNDDRMCVRYFESKYLLHLLARRYKNEIHEGNLSDDEARTLLRPVYSYDTIIGHSLFRSSRISFGGNVGE